MGLRKGTVNVIYFPDEDAVALQYRESLYTYHQFWSFEGRDVFLKALEQYAEDFTARNFTNSSRRSRRTYGTVEGFLIWQMHSFTTQARGNMDVELGYFFKNRAPYFTVTQREAEYIHPEFKSENRTSKTIIMYFTRAQAAELAALFDRQFLDGLTPVGTPRRIINRNIDFDEY